MFALPFLQQQASVDNVYFQSTNAMTRKTCNIYRNFKLMTDVSAVDFKTAELNYGALEAKKRFES